MTSNSLSFFRSMRSEWRANDLTVEALFRDMMRSAVPTVVDTFSKAWVWYAAYDKRQQRRRHLYRRALNAVSAERLSAQVAAETKAPAANRSAGTPAFHFVGASAKALPNEITPALPVPQADLPPAHVCAGAAHAGKCHAAS